MELYSLSIEEARTAIDKGEISPVELTEAVYRRIDAVENITVEMITVWESDFASASYYE